MTDKDFKTIDEQLEILRSRNLTIDDDEKAKDFLFRNNYYRISGYSLTIDNSHFYGFVLIMKRLLSKTDFESLKNAMITLTRTYPFVRMDYYGFRSDWQQKL